MTARANSWSCRRRREDSHYSVTNRRSETPHVVSYNTWSHELALRGRGHAEILLGFRGGCDKVTLHVLEPNRTRQPAGCGQLVHAWAVCGAAGRLDVRRLS